MNVVTFINKFLIFNCMPQKDGYKRIVKFMRSILLIYIS